MLKGFLSIALFSLFHSFSLLHASDSNSIFTERKLVREEEYFLSSLSSLSFLLQEEIHALKGIPTEVPFSEDDITSLWNKIRENDCLSFKNKESKIEKSYLYYLKAKQLSSENNTLDQAEIYLIRALNILLKCRESIIDAFHKSFEENQNPIGLTKVVTDRRINNAIFEDNKIIPKKVKHEMRPYVIQENHPMKSILDSIFLINRATLTKKTFLDSGFRPIGKMRPRSFVTVARHPQLPGYLVKAYFDVEKREKQKKPSWQWLVLRCQGANKVQRIIAAKNIRYFKVASKWIYPFPEEPFPVNDRNYKRHLALLLTTDMNLAPDSANLRAWKNVITEQHLNELYQIITHAKGSSYRPDNICYTNDGFFAFIDTEYPNRGPDYRSIRPHLSSGMTKYWDSIIRSGGPRRE